MTRRLLPGILILLAIAVGLVVSSCREQPPVPADKLGAPAPTVGSTVPRLVFAPSDRATYEFAAERGFRGEITFGFEIEADGSVQNVVSTSDADAEVLRRFAADLAARRYETAVGTRTEPVRLTATFVVGGS